MRSSRTRLGLTALVLTLALVGAACGDDDDSSADAGDSNSQTSEEMTTETTEKMMSETTMADSTAAAMTPTGPGCSAVPASGEGSFDGMADDPAATAASNNPALSTLVSAVQAAGLVDTLNGAGPFTIFAPTNDAFAKIPADTLNTVLADKDMLTKILTYHVVAGEQMDAAALGSAGTVTTVEGGDLTITSSGDTVKVNDATVVCANVPTANATVHLIDTVLMPM